MHVDACILHTHCSQATGYKQRAREICDAGVYAGFRSVTTYLAVKSQNSGLKESSDSLGGGSCTMHCRSSIGSSARGPDLCIDVAAHWHEGVPFPGMLTLALFTDGKNHTRLQEGITTTQQMCAYKTGKGITTHLQED